ncbi:MAG: homocysteine S-methyltransferase family protein [Phycisphaerales bacterium]|nr:MAG: homocysteine S-methyltransferase family protein [Phycisphaerales bacterium]
MAKMTLKDRIARGVLVLDGAMGTELIARGAPPGVCNDYLNLESPDIVLAVHRAYLEAGSDAVLTNTFGANRYALARHDFAERVREINEAGAQLARQAAGDQKYVLGDIGPSGDFLEPLGGLKAAELRDAFTEQAEALVAGGVGGLIIETMTALDELAIAIEAAGAVAGDLPVFASMAFDKTADGFRTMMGVDVRGALTKMASLGVDAAGFNCGTVSLDEYVELAGEYVSIAGGLSEDLVIYAEPNAGRPELVDGQAVYRVSPQEFAAAVKRIHEAGVNVLGGCCGTSPAHIKAVADMLGV